MEMFPGHFLTGQSVSKEDSRVLVQKQEALEEVDESDRLQQSQGDVTRSTHRPPWQAR